VLRGPPEAERAPDRHAVVGRLKAKTQFAADELIAPGKGLADIGKSYSAYEVVRYGVRLVVNFVLAEVGIVAAGRSRVVRYLGRLRCRRRIGAVPFHKLGRDVAGSVVDDDPDCIGPEVWLVEDLTGYCLVDAVEENPSAAEPAFRGLCTRHQHTGEREDAHQRKILE
jgi:hypothetical protein